MYVLDVSHPATPSLRQIVRTGLAVGENEGGIDAYGASHPNAVVTGGNRIYVSNGNNDIDHDPERRERPQGRRHLAGRAAWHRSHPQGCAAGVDRAQPGSPLPLRRRGRAERGGRRQPAGSAARGRPHPDGLVAVQRQGEPRRPHAVRGQRQGARRGAEPREPGAEAHGDGDGQRHRHPQRRRARRGHQAGHAQQRVRQR